MKRIQRTAGVLCAAGLVWLTGCLQTDDAAILLSAPGQTEEALQETSDRAGFPAPQDETDAGETQEQIYVHMCGEIAVPGVYAMPEGSRLVDAVNAAGGLKKGADVRAVNLAQEITDGMQIYIPSEQEEQEAQAQPGNAYRQGDGRIDINHAGLEELCSIPGIGESKASEILRYREQNGAFGRIEDIMKVTGIKQGLFEKIKEKICVR